jgi:predicted nucleotide-binding protein
VIFEVGFFFAQLGRLSGRVIVLYRGPTELPSDIQGLVWIGIDHGVDAAGEEIRREVKQFLVDAPGIAPR